MRDSEIINVEQQGNDDSSNIHMSLTASTKQMLFDNAEEPVVNVVQEIERSTESVYEIANRCGLSVQQWVQRNPDYAIRYAEESLSQWLKIQSQAAIEGCVTTSEGSFSININQAKMIELRCEQAQKQLDLVNEYAFIAIKDGEQKKDHLLRTMYNRAIQKGDSKLLIYLIDRVEGRPTETKTADLDYDNAYNVYQIIHTLFKKQLDILNAGNGTIMACCSRRAGKTRLLVAICLIECLRRPNVKCIYIGETMELTEGLIDSAANEIIDTCNLRDKRGRRFNWKKMDNGSEILVRGLSNTKDPDQIRGHKAKIIVIDEFFHLKSELLEYLQREVLEPMQMDYADDYKFICAGTPPSIKGTFGEYAWRNWDVPHFQWTWRDNPHPTSLEDREKYIEDKLREKGLSWDTPYARREYNGEWIYDEDLLLYPVYHTYDVREGIPQCHVDQVVVGIDYGVGDNDAVVGVAWDNEAKCGYVFHEDKFNRLDIVDRNMSQLQYLRGCVKACWEEAMEFFPGLAPREANKRILWDADDSDQHLTDDLNVNVRLSGEGRDTLKLNIQNAHKTDKNQMQDKIQDLLQTGSLLLPVNGECAHECDSTVLKRGKNGQVLPQIDDAIYHPDILSALRYAMWNVVGDL